MCNLAKARIEHLTKEIETLTINLMTFRTRIGFTILVGPFIVMGSVLIATKGEVVMPKLDWGFIGFAIFVLDAIIAYIFLAAWGWRFDKSMSDQCNIWREAIKELSKDQQSTPEITVKEKPRVGYLSGFVLVLISFLSIICCLWYVLPIRGSAWPGSVTMFEQCKAKLGKRLTSKQEVIDFAKEWNDGRYIDGDQDEAKFITTNIDRIVVEALARRLLFQLGKELGVGWDAEADGINVGAMDHRFRDRIGITVAGALTILLLILRLLAHFWEKQNNLSANAGTVEKKG